MPDSPDPDERVDITQEVIDQVRREMDAALERELTDGVPRLIIPEGQRANIRFIGEDAETGEPLALSPDGRAVRWAQPNTDIIGDLSRFTSRYMAQTSAAAERAAQSFRDLGSQIGRSMRELELQLETVNPDAVRILLGDVSGSPQRSDDSVGENCDMPGTIGCGECPACLAMASTREDTVTAPVEAEQFETVTQGSYAPAQSSQLRNIANGVYVFDAGRDENDSTVALRVQLYTVQRGQLSGQRILRRPGGDRTWDGFATLQEDGSVYVWRSHEAMRNTREHRVLNTQFRSMHHLGTRISSGTSVTLNGHTVRLEQRACNQCNRVTVGQMAFCQSCLSMANPSTREDERRFAPRVAEPVRPRTPRVPIDLNARPAATATRTRAVRAPLMSEIDPTRIR
jgi:hypothetical protein